MATPTFPLPSSYFTGGSHLSEADSAALAAILNQLSTVANAGGAPLDSSTPNTATFTPVVNKTYLVDPSGGAFGVTMPSAAVDGDLVRFKNVVDDVALFTITADAGRTIEGYTGIAEVGAAGASTTLGGTSLGFGFATFMLCGTVWRVINQG